MADRPDTQLQARCKYCEKKVIKKIKCVNCGAAFHKSCSARKICCDKQELSKETQDDFPSEDSDEESTNEVLLIESLKSENKILIDFNTELKDMNKLLKEKILILEDKIKSLTINRFEEHIVQEKNEAKNNEIRNLIKKEVDAFFSANRNETTKNNQKTSDNESKDQQQKPTQNTPLPINKNKKGHPNKQINSSANKNQNLINLEEKQQFIMQDIINLESPTPQPQLVISSPTKNEKWQQQKTRHQKRGIGQAQEINSKFKGIKPKVWMYLYRVEPDVTEQDIIDYLKQKTNSADENFIVEDLKANGKYKEYKVAADFSFKNCFYNPSFWPAGVRFKRFDFAYHKQRMNTNKNNNFQPNTFLEVETSQMAKTY